MFDVLQVNLCSPLSLAFALGVAAKLIRSELSLPRDLHASLSIYLLLALGLKGGVELSHCSFAEIARPAAMTLILGCVTPVTAYLVLRKIARFGVADSAGIAAHYGSVSAVTFIAAQQFVQAMGHPAEGFMPTLLTLLESPGIHIALAIGAFQRVPLVSPTDNTIPGTDIARSEKTHSVFEVLHEVLTARSMILLVGGLAAGYLMGGKGYEPVKPFFEGLFKGVLTLFLLDMGLSAGTRLGDLRRAGLALVGFGIAMPLIHGALGVYLGYCSGLSLGGAAVLGTMAASASYIAAPPAVRMTLPEANPTLYLTAALAITFPFNIVVGIPLYFHMARVWFGVSNE